MTASIATYVVARSCQNEPGMEASSHHSLWGHKMHILAILGAVMAGAAIWYWRVRTMHEAGSEVVDALGRVRGAYRRYTFRKKAEDSVLATVDDPAMAAAIFLFALANEGGISDRAVAEIRRQLSSIAAPDRLDETLAYAAWAAHSVVDSRDCIRRYKDLWRAQLTMVERQHLLSMAVAVRAVAARPDYTQKLAIDKLQAALAGLGKP